MAKKATAKPAKKAAPPAQPKRGRGRPRKIQAAERPLPPAVEPAAPPPAEPPKSASLFSLDQIFSQRENPEPVSSIESSRPSISEPLSHESERLLAAVPDHIGESAAGSLAAVEEGGVFGSEEISALMASVAFEEQDVQDTLSELFDWIAEFFESDHWKLSERQARMIGRPLAQVLNAVWADLCRVLPGPIARWIENTPGAAKLLIACGLVLVPKAKTQWSISRERRSLARQPQRVQPAPAPRPRVPQPVPSVQPVVPIVPPQPSVTQ